MAKKNYVESEAADFKEPKQRTLNDVVNSLTWNPAAAVQKAVDNGTRSALQNSGNNGGGSGNNGGGNSNPSNTVSGYAQPAASTPIYDTTIPSVFGDTQDPELQKQYQDAMAALEAMKGQAPVYGSQYDAQIQSLYQQIMGRGPFKYDQKTDPLYQQYVQDYVQGGKMAMRDTMGRAAGLTGGYGSSYAQAVGQQQYDQYLQKMADILPETYGMALDAYNAENNRLNQNLSTTMGLEQSDYQKYLDKLGQHNVDLDRAYNEADTAYGRMTDKEKENYNRQLDQYEMQKDAYNRLAQLISMGYTPTKEEFNAAGLSEAQGQALLGAYMPEPETVYVNVGGRDNVETVPGGTPAPTPEGTPAPTSAKKYSINDLVTKYKALKGEDREQFDKDVRSYVAAGNTSFTLDDWKYAKGR